MIETIENRYARRPYRIELSFPEFTSICPLTGAPDFGTITIAYVPSGSLLEQKSLRDFLSSFRGREIFQEEAVNAILDEVVTSCDPSFCEVEGVFNARRDPHARGRPPRRRATAARSLAEGGSSGIPSRVTAEGRRATATSE